MSEPLEVRWLGRIEFTPALAQQEELVRTKRANPDAPDELWLLEHEPVYTIGRTPDQSSLRGASHLPHPLVAINRGGQATYHGPGQLVGYFLIDLRRYGQDLHRYLRWMEALLVELLAEHKIEATTRRGLTGVWVQSREIAGVSRKIASIGVGVRHWITMHGFALNVSGDLSPFAAITPCGIADVSMTSMEKETGVIYSLESVATRIGILAQERIANLAARSGLPESTEGMTRHEFSFSFNEGMAIPFEDNFTDIIGKAQRGLGISDSQLAEKSGASVEAIRQLREGNFDRARIEQISPVLRLDANALAEFAEGKWQPNEVRVDGLAQFNTPYQDMTVNAYLVWDPASKAAVAFDSGADCSALLQKSKSAGLTIELILLTHAHPDHVADLERLAQITGAPIYLSEREQAPGARPIREGQHFNVGGLTIESLLTSGHSPGGMTFFVRGLDRPVAIVGDSLFAGSMGGGNVSYEEAVRNNLEKILTLPNDTILCPGHGPLTTVGEEKKHNPFFAR
jgi:hydroxyacylglutathione hydrolase